MRKPVTKGVCELCKGTFGKAAMTRHLARCLPAHEPAKGARGKLVHLVAEGKYNRQYWLHAELPATATLADLDQFLRDIWLECCGHLSMFTINSVRYSVAAGREDPFGWGLEQEDQSMSARVGQVLRVDQKFLHEYDFGSTTTLELKVVAVREGILPDKGQVRLLARNEPPALACERCGQPAAWVEVLEGWELLCDKCSGGEGEEGLLPVVNSPRVGVCGYTG